MILNFKSISEPGLPGKKWKNIFDTNWPAYKVWLDSKGKTDVPDLRTSQAALRKYMPEMWPIYQRLCKLVNADEVAACFLTGFQPPAYISGCSQAVITGKDIQLVRNYDYHPDLSEGIQLFTAWNRKKVIATSDCLIGVLDGMNEDGLAISLTFGGRKVVGEGFGIPFILRYVLEFCSNVEEAVEVLLRVPSHMSYNVTVVDKSGSLRTLRLAPDRKPVVTDQAFTTNHQGQVDWPENAAFNKTVERADCLKKLLSNKKLDATTLANSFLEPPLYNTRFKEGFGTLFTAVYRPQEGVVQLRWPQDYILQSFEDFQEESRVINFEQPMVPVRTTADLKKDTVKSVEMSNREYTEERAERDWQETLTEVLVEALAKADPSADKEKLDAFRKKFNKGGEVSWEVLSNYWSDSARKYTQFWKS